MHSFRLVARWDRASDERRRNVQKLRMGQKRGEKRLKNSCGEESLGDAAVAARGPADLCPNVTLFIISS